MSDVAKREWQRFTPHERAVRYSAYLVTAIAFSVALRSIEIVPEFLRGTPAQGADLLVRMWPVDWEFLFSTVVVTMVETIHIATLGALATLAIAFPLGVLAARNIVASPTVRFAAKLCLVVSRSVNSLVWALFFVAVFGPGALAGTVAITFRSIGSVGKLLGEAPEEVAPGLSVVSRQAVGMTTSPTNSAVPCGSSDTGGVSTSADVTVLSPLHTKVPFTFVVTPIVPAAASEVEPAKTNPFTLNLTCPVSKWAHAVPVSTDQGKPTAAIPPMG